MKFTSDTVAVITGGASGIGLGLAEAVVSRGGRVVISDIREQAIAPALEHLRTLGGEAIGVVADVGDPAAIEALAARSIAAFGRVDVVCNNAGLVSPGAPSWEQDLSAWTRMMQVKVFGVIHGIRAFVPHLIRQGAGHVINTASSAGLAPLPDRSPYTTSMHAVVGLTETLDLELKRISADLGATVLCPGLVDTPLGPNSAALGAISLPTGAPVDMRALRPDILSPRDVAEATIAAVEAGRTHVAPGADVLPRARARVDELMRDLSDAGGQGKGTS
ncbi:NAD(P)-dependent dehydrogenase (short-subunit alcohol dehydrogenase family) [Microbacterium trichothecenolyticum]|uniref:SDR family NAD(P)-dependent oxidoreductase n=1 Tax=Microbacterium trichothecenolyticum TaxID=69370 RepID=UPI0028614562|nr:SDR family NAD(P)-dependent oxidoreductase [Microbacterium trichothecenolyticum]MDR7113711.1 NAD(P)-dependent dehydrogenase (short-subunit alcohol dehydrogenase family) [Microbacterium trichothecenolyticum]